jgi:hypothetical protein
VLGWLRYGAEHHCWDIETVPDLRGFAAANGLIGKSGRRLASLWRCSTSSNTVVP